MKIIKGAVCVKLGKPLYGAEGLAAAGLALGTRAQVSVDESKSAFTVEIHPADARRLGIAPHSQITVTSRRASLTATAFVTPTVQPGQLFIPMHYDAVNRLTLGSFDPHSRQPSYKHCAVKVMPR